MNSEEQHPVTLTHALEVSRYETTQEEWVNAGYKNRSGSIDDGNRGRDCTEPRCPVGVITWADAVAYANRKSRVAGLPTCIDLLDCEGEEGAGLQCRSFRQRDESYYDCRGYRLPTSVEFQYLLRAGTTTAYYTGDFAKPSNECYDLEHVSAAAWYCANSGNHSHPVGQLLPNAWGLHDMMGNAAEYTASAPHTPDRKSSAPQTDPHARLPEDNRVEMRGGLFNAWPALLRSADQGVPVPTEPFPGGTVGAGGGFRVVRSLTANELAAWK